MGFDFYYKPSARKSDTVSKMLEPEVMMSSMIKHESPAPNLPSIIFLVPYDFASLRRINIGLFCLVDSNVAIGSAV